MNSYDFFICEFICFMNSFGSNVPDDSSGFMCFMNSYGSNVPDDSSEVLEIEIKIL